MTLYNNFLLKRGVGLFSRVGLISGDYGIYSQLPCNTHVDAEVHVHITISNHSIMDTFIIFYGLLVSAIYMYLQG